MSKADRSYMAANVEVWFDMGGSWWDSIYLSCVRPSEDRQAPPPRVYFLRRGDKLKIEIVLDDNFDGQKAIGKDDYEEEQRDFLRSFNGCKPKARHVRPRDKTARSELSASGTIAQINAGCWLFLDNLHYRRGGLDLCRFIGKLVHVWGGKDPHR